MGFFGTQPRVIPYFGYRSASRLTLSVRALRSGAADWGHTTTFAKLRALFSHFASREVANLPVTIEAGTGERTVSAAGTTDKEGYCHFDLQPDAAWPLPDTTAWETVKLAWSANGETCEAPGYVLAPGRQRRLAIISDIDDTILETGAHDLLRNWRRVLAQMPGERVPVPGARALYDMLGGPQVGDRMGASHRPFFYISSSPFNLFDYLVAFKRAHGLPLGPMMLRDWGFNRATLGGSGHGAHKTAAIARLARFYPDMRFALVGDSTQADAAAYADAVTALPDRIAGVLIRKAPGAAIDAAEHAAFDVIRTAGVPLWAGEDFAVEEDFLAALGLEDEDEARALVEKTGPEG